jgi:Tfp pilus assembly protein PilN
MSVRVNLLPREAVEKQSAARQRNGVAGGALVLVALLGLLYWWQVSRVNDARDELAIEQARVDELQAEVNALSEFDELQRRRNEADESIETVLSDEVTVAGILQDLAAVMPNDAQLDTLAVTLGQVDAPDGTASNAVGNFNLTGKTLTSHAPGVERLLLSLDKIVSFTDLFVNSSTLEDPEDTVANFSVEGNLGPEVRTERYRDGLPQELR